MTLIVVLGLTVFGANGMVFSFDKSAAADNVPVMTPLDAVPGVQSDDGLVCIVYLEITDVSQSGPAAVSAAQADIIHQLPDTTTLVLLGLGGLLYRRRKEQYPC